MTSNRQFVAWTLIALTATACSDGGATARPSDFETRYHGVTVADPYRWMEDMASVEVSNWARSQDRFARDLTSALPEHEELIRRIAAASDYTFYTSPLKRGDRHFYTRLDAAATRVDVMLRVANEERALVDGEALAEQDLTVNRYMWPSPDGRVVAYGVSALGSRWMELRFHDVEAGRDLSDRLEGLQARRLSNVSWNVDGSGVWYDVYDVPPPEQRVSAQLEGSRVAFHRLGMGQNADATVARAPEGGRITHQATDDGRWLFLRDTDGGRSSVGLLDIAAEGPDGAPRTLLEETEATVLLVGSAGDEVWLYTDLDAPNGRIVGVRTADWAPSAWRDIVPERPDPVDTWTGAVAVGDVIVVGYRHWGLLELRIFKPRGGSPDGDALPLPRIGSVWYGVTGRQGDPEFFYLLSGFADPGTIYRHDLESGKSTPFLRPQLPYDPEEFVTRQVFYSGPAGDSIPMYLAHHRSVEPDAEHPVMMYGYGFGNWSASPWFRPHMAEWFRAGGVFALPAIRGGGEFGAEWARSGLKTSRQNAIDDYLAAARWLFEQGLAAPERFVAETNSAGGPLVGAAIVQAPELFGAAIIAFPLMDLLRYEAFTGGRRWRSQLGSVENEAEFRALLGYAPIQNVRPGTCYPPTMVLPGELDETTPPFHAYKFVAALQAAQSCDAPILLRVAWGAGHTYGRDRLTTVESFADQLTFLRQVLSGQDLQADR